MDLVVLIDLVDLVDLIPCMTQAKGHRLGVGYFCFGGAAGRDDSFELPGFYLLVGVEGAVAGHIIKEGIRTRGMGCASVKRYWPPTPQMKRRHP